MPRNREAKTRGDTCDTVTFFRDDYEDKDEEDEGSTAKVAKGNRERRRSEDVDDHGSSAPILSEWEKTKLEDKNRISLKRFLLSLCLCF
ncbi:hypothetical protein FNV43_RR02556 [Rhamnella rubrinervis]|uniref:Uncharacterized protein n=1 Tax=Rhamnella rubrinervis TaxID=2594499 RepID=A0A8K0MT31_9ROSA|nr:hypothetical protein FNV43_RR02556 [Rhamnella rubrinervis]